MAAKLCILNKNYVLKLKEKLLNNKELLSFYESNLFEIDSEIYNEYLRSDKSIDYLIRWIKKSNMRCLETNKVIPYERFVLKKYTKYFDDTISFKKKACMTGKKRPDFAIKISNLLKGKKKKKEVREKMANRLKSIDFKKKVILNKKLINESCNDEVLIKKIYMDNFIKTRKSTSFKLKFLKTNFEKFKIKNLDYKQINSLSDDQICLLYSQMQSIKSSMAMSNNLNMGNSKNVILNNLKFNIDKLTSIEVRSSMEADIIYFFEKNSIYWNYEKEVITYFYKFYRNYILDFDFFYNGKKYFLEVKGSVKKSQKDKTIEKIKAGIKNGNFILYQRENIVTIEDLIALQLKNESDIKLNYIYED